LRPALAACVVCAVALLANCSRAPSQVSLLLITLDTTRADHLGTYGLSGAKTPHLDRLAAEGIRYEHAYSPAPITLPAHASLMTGLYPFEHGVRDNGTFRLSEGAVTLAEILQRRGYRTGAAVGAFVLDRRFGLAQGFDHYDDAMPPERSAGPFGFTERGAPAVTDAALAWFDEHGHHPFFLWVHYFDPHAAHDPHVDDPELAALLPYDAEIAYMDREIGRLVDRLRTAQRDAQTLIVVAADHGEGLWEHGEISHGYFVYQSTLRAALILRLPDAARTGIAIAQPVSLVDVFPTVLEQLGIEPPAVSGRVLPTGGDSEDAKERSIYFENYAVAYSFGLHPLRGIVRGHDKWIDAPRPERYDLAADPHETENRYTPEDALSEELRAAANELLDDAAHTAAHYGDTILEPDAEITARLLALGYQSARIAPDELTRGPDPKDKVADLREVLAAQSLFGAGQPERAAATLAAVLRTADYINPRALIRLAELAPEEPARALAIDTLLPYLERDLDRELRFAVAAKLGVALGRSGRYAEAVRAYEIAAELEPHNPEVQRGLENARRLRAEAR